MLPCQQSTNKVILYFHANAEDIGLSYPLLDFLRTYTKCHVIAPEFPGYGIYNKTVPKAKDEVG